MVRAVGLVWGRPIRGACGGGSRHGVRVRVRVRAHLDVVGHHALDLVHLVRVRVRVRVRARVKG